MEYKIIATHITVDSPTGFRCTVAIDAGHDDWKAYEALLTDYPDWEQIQQVAAQGKKLTSALADRRFPEVASLFERYG